MRRKDWRYRQLVTESELDGAFDDVENGIWDLAVDLGFFGVAFGLDAAQQSVPNLTVALSAGVALDQTGRRCRVPTGQTVDVSTDENNLPTAVANSGDSKYVSIFLEFQRSLSDPQTDGNQQIVYFVRDESFRINVVQGIDGVSPSRPALRSDQVLLCDILLTYGQTAVVSGDISTTRRQWCFASNTTPKAIGAGRALGAILQVLGYYNAHVLGSDDKHASSDVTAVASTATWRDSTGLGSGTVLSQIEEILTDLRGNASGSSGAEKVGCAEFTAWNDGTQVTASSIWGAIDQIMDGLGSVAVGTSGAHKVLSAVLGAFADGVTVANGSIWAQLDGIRGLLAATAGGNSGAHKLGSAALAAWADASVIAAGTLWSQVNAIPTALAAAAGASRIGIAARTAWLGGRANAATDLFSAVDKIITDLGLTTSSDDGAERIGAQASGNLSSGSVRSQLDALDTAKGGLSLANTWSLLQTFSLGLITPLYYSSGAAPSLNSVATGVSGQSISGNNSDGVITFTIGAGYISGNPFQIDLSLSPTWTTIIPMISARDTATSAQWQYFTAFGSTSSRWILGVSSSIPAGTYSINYHLRGH